MIYDAKFWESEIEEGAILSYDWLLRNKVGVFPHHRALALDTSNLRLIYGKQSRDQKYPEKVPILVSKLDSPKDRRKWRLKENVSGRLMKIWSYGTWVPRAYPSRRPKTHVAECQGEKHCAKKNSRGERGN